MKKTLSILMLPIALISCGGAKEKKNNELGFDEVYVCTGKYAKRYHCDENCKGLGSCKGEIRLVPISTAKKQGKTPCGYCY